MWCLLQRLPLPDCSVQPHATLIQRSKKLITFKTKTFKGCITRGHLSPTKASSIHIGTALCPSNVTTNLPAAPASLRYRCRDGKNCEREHGSACVAEGNIYKFCKATRQLLRYYIVEIRYMKRQCMCSCDTLPTEHVLLRHCKTGPCVVVTTAP